MTHTRKILPLLAIVGTLMLTPGAMKVDWGCQYGCIHQPHARILIEHGDHSCARHGFLYSGYGYLTDRYRRLDRGWTRPLPDLREYGLY